MGGLRLVRVVVREDATGRASEGRESSRSARRCGKAPTLLGGGGCGGVGGCGGWVGVGVGVWGVGGCGRCGCVVGGGVLWVGLEVVLVGVVFEWGKSVDSRCEPTEGCRDEGGGVEGGCVVVGVGGCRYVVELVSIEGV